MKYLRALEKQFFDQKTIFLDIFEYPLLGYYVFWGKNPPKKFALTQLYVMWLKITHLQLKEKMIPGKPEFELCIKAYDCEIYNFHHSHWCNTPSVTIYNWR